MQMAAVISEEANTAPEFFRLEDNSFTKYHKYSPSLEYKFGDWYPHHKPDGTPAKGS